MDSGVSQMFSCIINFQLKAWIEILICHRIPEEPAAGLFEGDLFADAPLPQSEVQPTEQDSDDDMDACWDTGGRSPGSR